MAQELSAVPALGGVEAGKSIWLELAASTSQSQPGTAIPSLYCQGYFPPFPATLLSAFLGVSTLRFPV